MCERKRGRERERERERERDIETETEKETEGEREREGQRGTERGLTCLVWMVLLEVGMSRMPSWYSPRCFACKWPQTQGWLAEMDFFTQDKNMSSHLPRVVYHQVYSCLQVASSHPRSATPPPHPAKPSRFKPVYNPLDVEDALLVLPPLLRLIQSFEFLDLHFALIWCIHLGLVCWGLGFGV